MNLEILLNALEELLKEREIIKNDLHFLIEYDELSNIISEILNTTFQAVGMREIEKRVTRALELDIDTLELGLNLIEKAEPTEITIRAEDPVQINPQEIIEKLRDFISSYKSKKIDRINALINFELYCDREFDRLLMTFSSTDKIFDGIQLLLNKKLENLDKDDLLLFWAKIKSWFNHDNNNYNAYPVHDDIIPAGFFSERNSSTSLKISEKCAIMIAKYVPLTIRRMIEAGVNRFPIGLAGVAKLLAITNTSEISSITQIEYLLIRSFSQTIAIYEAITNNKPSVIAKHIGADINGLIIDGEYISTFRKKIFNSKIADENKNKLLLYNLRRLVQYTKLFAKKRASIEEALRQYKVGQEVFHPNRKSEFDNVEGSLEIYLQKDMCKFLIERNIPAFGKAMGRNILDLYYKESSGEDFTIEAKVYKNKKNLSLSSLKDNLVQLQSYMDLHDQPRGILAIFNFTNTLIMAPTKWIRGRILILCINLCDSPASSRKASIEIVESETDVIQLIKVSKT